MLRHFGISLFWISLVLIAHGFGVYIFYHIYTWYDVPMHLIGGFVSGILAWQIWTYSVDDLKMKNGIGKQWILFLFIIGLTALIAVVWELHEFVLDYFREEKRGFSLQEDLVDTMKDILLGLIGGLFAYFVYARK